MRHNVTNAVTREGPHYCPGGQPMPGPATAAPHDTIGLDLHKRESQLCTLGADGTVTERRIATTRPQFTTALGGRAPARVLLEASTESEWVARHLEALGHTVIVADPNYAPMYATRSRRVKTDKRDARTLAEACRLGAYRPAHRLSDAQRHVRAELAVRDALVRTRTRYIAVLKALVRRDGLRLPAGDAERTATKFAVLDATGAVSSASRTEVAPLLAVLAPLNEQIAAADQRLTALAATDAAVQRLTTAPGIGPVTATAFVATLDDVARFRDAHQVMAYLGLVPSERSSGERSSGERQQRGRITKAGSPRVRWLLVEAAWRLQRSRDPDAAPLQAWAARVAVRRGTRVAMVALARRLAGVPYVMWRDGTDYSAARVRSRADTTPEVATA
ncbi:IS110 family transposase [Gemmatimonadetes bacterium T265]|nr:IS110 family transposase [Gemmatimonadetes bacterium T265]